MYYSSIILKVSGCGIWPKQLETIRAFSNDLMKGITLFTMIHDPINGKPDIIVLYQARDNAYA